MPESQNPAEQPISALAKKWAWPAKPNLLGTSVKDTESPGVEVLVSLTCRGPISGKTGYGWCSSHAKAIAVGSTPLALASSRARSSLRKFSSE